MNPLSNAAYLYLAAAIVAEVVGTTALKYSNGMSRPGAVAVVVLGYATAFWLMSISLKSLPVGLVYAVWAGVGIVLIKLVGVTVFREPVTLFSVLGIVLIAAGVVLLHIESKA